jgi:hypothetical protein
MRFTTAPNTNAKANRNKTELARKIAGLGRFEMGSLEPRLLWSATPVHHHPHAKVPDPPELIAASGLTATLNSPSSIKLNWQGDGIAAGYMVMIAVDGSGYMGIAAVTGATSYLISGLVPGHTYSFEVQAYGKGETAPPSNAASVALGIPTPLTPTGLTAKAQGAFIDVSWNVSQNATGYDVLRSTNGSTYTQISQQTSGNAYLDSNVAPGQKYYYEVMAFNGTGNSSASAPISFTTGAAPIINGVAVTTRFGDELVITATGADDSISVGETGTTLQITADGTTYTDPAPAAGLFIYTRGGADSIALASSVTEHTTLETIDAAITTIKSAASNVIAWIDSTDIFTGSGTVHRVSTFEGGTSKATGASLANPSDSGATKTVNLSPFGTGPVIGDVNQGGLGDCYFLASLAAFADVKPSVLENAIVDMGDGTYVVQFMNGNTPTYVRVNNAFSTGGFGGFAYAHPGGSNTIWAMILEKAFAEYRYGANTYASISAGWMGEVYSDLGVSSTNFLPSSDTASSFYTQMSTALANGDAVTLGTKASPPNLVGDHAYTLLSCSMVNGVPMFTVRNPWGFAGDSLENSQGIATLTFAQISANFAEGAEALG